MLNWMRSGRKVENVFENVMRGTHAVEAKVKQVPYHHRVVIKQLLFSLLSLCVMSKTLPAYNRPGQPIISNQSIASIHYIHQTNQPTKPSQLKTMCLKRPSKSSTDAATTKIAKTTAATSPSTCIPKSGCRPTVPMPDYYEYLKDAPSTNSRPIRRRKRTNGGNNRPPLLADRDGCHILALADEIERMVQEQIEREQRERA